MPFTKNIVNFTPSKGSSELLRAYCQLIVIELALKHSGIPGIGYGGHNLPNLLQLLQTAVDQNAYPNVTSSLNSFVIRLKNDLQNIWCIHKDGSTNKVPAYSYPHMRYARLTGDWAGIAETPNSDITGLLNTATDIANFLRLNVTATGVRV